MPDEDPNAHHGVTQEEQETEFKEVADAFPELHAAVMGKPFSFSVNNAFMTWLMLDVVLPSISKADPAARSYVAETLIIMTHDLPGMTSESLVAKGPFPDVDNMTPAQVEMLADASVAAKRSAQKAYVGLTVEAVSYATSAFAQAKLAAGPKPISTILDRFTTHREAAYIMVHNKLVEMAVEAEALEAAKPPRKPISFDLKKPPAL